MNPSGSVKDRAAVNMVDLAMRSGLIKRGDVVCEATGGNTGVSLALVSASQGFRTILCMTAGVSKEKQDLMRLYGAEIVLCPPGDHAPPPEYLTHAEEVTLFQDLFGATAC